MRDARKGAVDLDYLSSTGPRLKDPPEKRSAGETKASSLREDNQRSASESMWTAQTGGKKMSRSSGVCKLALRPMGKKRQD